MMKLKEELEKRGFLYQFSNEEAFEAYGKGGESFYCGFDPTADSLHLGNFIGFMMGVHLMKRNNKYFALIGWATGMIWDPGGKDAERNFLSEEKLRSNQHAIESQIKWILGNLEDFTGEKFDFETVNNYDFYQGMNYLDFLREVGKFMTVNTMMRKDTVKKRIEDPDKSISYTEFSYMLLQGYDFYKLYAEDNVKLQIGGQDQWGNLMTGVELIRKKTEKGEWYAITFPLIVDATGRKFGKSEGNALFLDKKKTTPYTIYQYFMNINDDDVERYLKILTLMDLDEIDELVKKHMETPEARLGQSTLAEKVVEIIHGKKDTETVKKISKIMFTNNKEEKLQLLSELKAEEINDLWEEIGFLDIKWWESILDILVNSELTASRWEAKKLLKQWGVSLNEKIVTDLWLELDKSNLLENGIGFLRKGKKSYRLIKM